MKKLFFASAAVIALAASPASGADLPRKPVYKAPPPVVAPVPFSWTGFYIGANVGYSWGRSSNDWNFFAPADNSSTGAFPNGDPTICAPTGNAFCASGSDANKLNGAIGGPQAGYNWQTGKFLAGVETDFQLSSQKGNQLFSTSGLVNPIVSILPAGSGTVSAAYTEKLPWIGTLRGRVGFMADRVLFYATGGLAYGRVTDDGFANNTVTFPRGPCSTSPCQFPVGSWSNGVTKVGWTLGGGVEGAISEHWSVKVEYLYVDLGTVNTTFATLPETIPLCGGRCTFFDAGSGTIRSRITDNIVRVGINYRFAWGKAPTPVVAKY